MTAKERTFTLSATLSVFIVVCGFQRIQDQTDECDAVGITSGVVTTGSSQAALTAGLGRGFSGGEYSPTVLIGRGSGFKQPETDHGELDSTELGFRCHFVRNETFWRASCCRLCFDYDNRGQGELPLPAVDLLTISEQVILCCA